MSTDTEDERGAFGRVLRRLRREAGLSQEELAERAGLSVEGISALERGRRRAPYRTTIRLIGDALGTSETQRGELERAAERRLVRTPSTAYDSWDIQPPHRSGQPQQTSLNRHNLLHPLSTFFGREAEIESIETLLDAHRLVSIVGSGGIGKTRIALELGWNMLGRFRDGIWFIDLAPLRSESIVARSITGILGIPSGGDDAGMQALLHHLESREALLIVDNCEHVADQVALLAETLLPTCLGLRFLVTSRERLRIAGERVYLVPPLELPPAFSLLTTAQSLSFPAVQLFVDRARSLNVGFPLNDGTVQTICEICRRLDGIALAIELAASRTAAFAPIQILMQIDEHFGTPAANVSAAAARHRTMHETIRWSAERLSEQERSVLRCVSIFANGFTLESARVVVGPADANEPLEPIVAALVDRSLFAADPQANTIRYRLLQPVRAFALEMLSAADETGIVRKRFLDWCVTVVKQAHDAWETSSSSVWSATVEPEMDNLRSALIWALDKGNAPLYGQRLISGARRLFGRLSPSEGKRWLEKARTFIAADTPNDVLASLTLAEAYFDIFLQLYHTALHAARKYEELVGPEAADEIALAEARGMGGLALLKQGQTKEGEILVKNALRLFRARGSHQLIAQSLTSLGIAHLDRCDFRAARTFFREALGIFQSLGNNRGASSAATNLAETEFRAGYTIAAISLCEQALAFSISGREARLNLTNLAAYLITVGRYEEAKARACESILCGGIARADVDVAFALQHLAAIATHQSVLQATDRDGMFERSARLVGFIDRRLTQHGVIREFTEQSEYASLLPILVSRLGEDRFHELEAEGAFWTEEEALDNGLSV